MNRAHRWLLCAALLPPGLVFADTNGMARYQAIADRNVFGLRAAAPAPSNSSAVEPKEDLLLTGVSDVGGRRCALFMIIEPGRPASHFLLHEGEQNAWLEVRSVNTAEATVRGRLKKPVVRMRTVGAEVVLTFLTQPAPRRSPLTFDPAPKKSVAAEMPDGLAASAANQPKIKNETP